MPVYQNYKRGLSQYYTPKNIASYCFNKAVEVIGSKNITEYLEPCAGTGVFLDLFDKPFKAYDIDPKDNRIEQQDFLKSELEYKKGRLCITNPPFNGPNDVGAFFNKAKESSQYIAFILPISYLGKYNKLGRFKLLYSEDLGFIDFDGSSIKTCFNIYDATIKVDNKAPKSKYFEIHSVRRDVFTERKFVRDYGNIIIQSWGRMSIKKSVSSSAKSIVLSFNADCPDSVKQEVNDVVKLMISDIEHYFPHIVKKSSAFLSTLHFSFKLKELLPQYFED